jgi:hypothetical protein
LAFGRERPVGESRLTHYFEFKQEITLNRVVFLL